MDHGVDGFPRRQRADTHFAGCRVDLVGFAFRPRAKESLTDTTFQGRGAKRQNFSLVLVSVRESEIGASISATTVLGPLMVRQGNTARESPLWAVFTGLARCGLRDVGAQLD